MRNALLLVAVLAVAVYVVALTLGRWDCHYNVHLLPRISCTDGGPAADR